MFERYLDVDPSSGCFWFHRDVSRDIQRNQTPVASPTIDRDVASDAMEPGCPSCSRWHRISRPTHTEDRLRSHVVRLMCLEATAERPPEGIPVLSEPRPSLRTLALVHLTSRRMARPDRDSLLV